MSEELRSMLLQFIPSRFLKETLKRAPARTSIEINSDFVTGHVGYSRLKYEE
jgi:uncharacterized membrane protein